MMSKEKSNEKSLSVTSVLLLIIAIVAGLSLLGYNIFSVPGLTESVKGVEDTLPALTSFFLGMSDYLAASPNRWLIIGAGGIVIIGLVGKEFLLKKVSARLAFNAIILAVLATALAMEYLSIKLPLDTLQRIPGEVMQQVTPQ